jgi:predicted ATPase/DNA-binding winged helix-turn-helix (wHTH) protein
MNRDNATVDRGIEFGSFRLFPVKRLLELDGVPITVSSRALDILILLVERGGQVVSKKELIAHAWPQITVDEAGLRVHIAGLRKCLGASGASYIKNVPGRGYCFVEPVSRVGLDAGPAVESGAKMRHILGLPPQLGRMVGREEDISRITELLEVKRFVTIHGPGGIGKTTTAISVGHSQRPVFADAVHFLDLGELNEARFLPDALASTLGLSVPVSDSTEIVLTFLKKRRMLLIFDSCEPLIDAIAAFAERIFHEAPQVHILATSRETLQVEGEFVYRLPALKCPPENATQTAKEVLSFAAPNLFVERVAASGQQFELSDADAPIVARVCRKLDGIALAIELAAAQVSTHGLHETAALLDSRLRLLWHGRRTALPRHQTLTAALNWSYDLLNEVERKILRSISIFVGPFTLEAACAVSGEESVDNVVHVFWQLIAKSLLIHETDNGAVLYRLLDATRGFAFEKLLREDEADQVGARLAQYYLQALDSRQVGDWKRNLGNIRTALEWSLIEGRNVELGIALAAASTRIFIEHSLFGECLYWSERALSINDASMRNAPRELALQAAFGLSLMLTQGNHDRVREALMRALDLAEALNDSDYQFRILSRLHLYYRRAGYVHRLFEIAHKAERAAKNSNDRNMIAAANSLLGVSAHLTGDQGRARAYFEGALAQPARVAITQLTDFELEFQPRTNVALARTLWLTGYPDQAVEAARRAVDELGAKTHPVTYCIVLLWGLSVFHWVGDFLIGERMSSQLSSYAEEHGLATYLAAGNAHKGRAMVMSGDIEDGISVMRTSLDRMHENVYDLYSIDLNRVIAEELAKSDRIAEALAIIDKDVDTAERNGYLLVMPELLRIRGNILQRASRGREAEECFVRSLDLSGQQSALSWHLRTSVSLAQLLKQQRRLNEARDILRSSYERFDEGFETADLIEARRVLAEIDVA